MESREIYNLTLASTSLGFSSKATPACESFIIIGDKFVR